MNFKRAATLVAVSGALAAWLAGAATSSHPQAPSSSVVVAPTLDLHGAALATEVARLHERLRPGVAPTNTRNLFAYSSRRPRAAPFVAPVAPALPSVVDTLVPTAPTFTLVGVAEDNGPDGVVRTAIITGLGQLFTVKEGDSVTAQYRVSRISTDVAELTESGGGPTIRLALK